MKNMIFIDIETTGLDPISEEIIEFGMVLVDGAFDIIESFSAPILPPQAAFKIDHNLLDPFILKMHGSKGSGLLDKIAGRRLTDPRSLFPNEVKARVMKTLDDWGVNKTYPVYGSSVAFDRKFLAHHYPAINDAFHYRSVDSSSDMERLKNRYPRLWAKIDNDPSKLPHGKHDALSDLAYSVDLERRLDKWVYNPRHQAQVAWDKGTDYKEPFIEENK